MLSIIISSQNKTTLDRLVVNIEATIGIPYELIVVENAGAKMGICKAYNTGAATAKFDFLCFMHEDILFETNDWGKKILHHFEDPRVGLIGVAGGDTKGLAPSGWSSSVFNSEISIIQHFKHSPKQHEKIIKTGQPKNTNTCKEVICIDGVWMCTRKAVFEKYKFDDIAFNNFHGYDIDYSLQVKQDYKVCVVFDILMNHYSEGNYNKAWLESLMAVSEKWKDQLPLTTRQLSKEQLITQHWASMENFALQLNGFKYSLYRKLLYLARFSFNKQFHLIHFLHCLRLLLMNTGSIPVKSMG